MPSPSNTVSIKEANDAAAALRAFYDGSSYRYSAATRFGVGILEATALLHARALGARADMRLDGPPPAVPPWLVRYTTNSRAWDLFQAVETPAADALVSRCATLYAQRRDCVCH